MIDSDCEYEFNLQRRKPKSGRAALICFLGLAIGLGWWLWPR